MKRRNIVASALSALALLVVPRRSESQEPSYTPPRGFIPDQQTAIAVAKAILIPIYGEKQINAQDPFHATLKNGVWTVTGSLPPSTVGGTASLRINKKDARVLTVIHTK